LPSIELLKRGKKIIAQAVEEPVREKRVTKD
jgi:hypothetical protein